MEVAQQGQTPEQPAMPVPSQRLLEGPPRKLLHWRHLDELGMDQAASEKACVERL